MLSAIPGATHPLTPGSLTLPIGQSPSAHLLKMGAGALAFLEQNHDNRAPECCVQGIDFLKEINTLRIRPRVYLSRFCSSAFPLKFAVQVALALAEFAGQALEAVFFRETFAGFELPQPGEHAARFGLRRLGER
jgi:hypothetical protein